MIPVTYPSQLQAELLPEGAIPEFRFTLPEMQLPEEVNLTEYFLDRNLRGEQANRIAFYSGDRQITYQALHEMVNRLGNGLRGLGIGKGDRVILRIPNCVEFVVCALALHRLGAVVIPTISLLREAIITYIANSVQAKVIISSHDLLDEIDSGRQKYQTVEDLIAIGGDPSQLKERGYFSYQELIQSSGDRLESVKVKRDDLAVIFFTSGTTGMPKGCMHMHLAVMGGIHSTAALFGGIRPDDVMGGTPPLAFVIGYGVMMLMSLLYGVPCVLIEGRVTPETMFETIQRYRVSIFNSNPTGFTQMLNVPGAEKKYDLSSLREMQCGSAPMLPALFHQWKARFGTELTNGMGSTETFGGYFGNREGQKKPAALGSLLPSWEARIIDDQGKDCSRGAIGRLALKGPSGIMYWRNPEKQKEAVIDGWSLTGDLAYQDEDGCFWHVSRSDDIIKSRGYRISPGEVEDALLEHPAVFESAVIGAPDPIQGSRGKAFVVLKEGRPGTPELAEELRLFVRGRLAPYQAPSEVEFVASLPRTETGKVRRVELKEMEEKRGPSRPSPR